ncbi:MOB kinase activator 2-like isoform X1 [Haliotis rubra]|uniref:MOB kinase activator 2-like isoform X1 n=1 Tax=Haliotis rubra TaxID=36100 RepID=UPI001EE60CC7|nr:MOB kinase activator 2-like isoform X1 [Haliotis rubra]
MKEAAKRYLWQTMRKGRRKDKDSPTPPASEEQRQYLGETFIKERVTEADFFKLVSLPPHLDYNEWLATHTIAFFNHVNLMYGVISEYCTSEGQACSSMAAPGSVQYYWYDDKGKKYKYSAPQYIDYVMTYIQTSITDESVFPTKFGHVFPNSFETVVKKVHRYLLQVLAHIYHAHYRELLTLGLHGHLNSLFTHFMVFNMEFNLLEEKDTEVLQDLVEALLKCLEDYNQSIQDNAANEDSADTPEDTSPQQPEKQLLQT